MVYLRDSRFDHGIDQLLQSQPSYCCRLHPSCVDVLIKPPSGTRVRHVQCVEQFFPYLFVSVDARAMLLFIENDAARASNRQDGGIARLDESWLHGATVVVVRYSVSLASGTRAFSLFVEENSKQHIVALCLPGPSNRVQAGSMMSADYQHSATLTPTRSSNRPLVCKIRSRSTPVCSHTQPRCVTLEHGLGEAHNAASSQYLP
jgi:hypothetical protein